MAEKLQLTMPDELIEAAKVKAVKEKVSLSAVARVWFTAWVNGEVGTPEVARSKEPAQG